MKRLSTTMLHNVLRVTTFVLIVSPSDVFLKIQILNFSSVDIILFGQMIQNEKVVN